MKNFKIPQEVQREDRIFGPITMRRLIILTVGGGITYLFYINLEDAGAVVWGPPVFILLSFTLALAFIEPFGMRFEKFLTRGIEFFSLPRKQKWDSRGSHDIFFEYIAYGGRKQQKAEEKINTVEQQWEKKQETRKTIEDISPFLDNDLSDLNFGNIGHPKPVIPTTNLPKKKSVRKKTKSISKKTNISNTSSSHEK